MPNVAVVLRDEIQRLARKEIRAAIAPLKKHRAEDRRAIAALKRTVVDLERRIAALEKRDARSPGTDAKTPHATGVRFSPKWVASDRARLGLSARDYGLLVGVTGLTIYNWEKGKSRPRAKQLAAWAKVRAMGKREAWKRLEQLDGE